ncbi:KH domain-containing protein [Campylobacter sp. FMV-PI01]|uniref:KH domain-containing protein n=1 Tax=Campylobacter portucalensis TaxID=2608384 RepID=A0A6L5WG35_9BACT|nr:KH domain-containing protein [Campylobacter portucalensis]MSN96098.1 KH domain-containing protein [Campylobacter portucalensis]
MVEEFLKQYAILIAEKPEKISVKKLSLKDSVVELIIYADKVDIGKLIGKDGRIINAIKTVILGSKSKSNFSYKVNVKAIEDNE